MSCFPLPQNFITANPRGRPVARHPACAGRVLSLARCLSLFLLMLLMLPMVHTVAAPLSPADVAQDRSALLQGLSGFEAEGVPSALGLYEARAFAVAAQGTAGALSVPVAASSIGNGRIIAFGQYYLDGSAIQPNHRRLISNAVQWANSGRTPVIGVLSSINQGAVINNLAQLGLSASALTRPLSANTLAGINTLVLDAILLQTASDLELVRSFVRGGGALLISANGWAWPVYTAPGKSLKDDFLANQLLAEAGIVWTEGTVQGNGVINDLPATLNALSALDYQTGGGSDSTQLNQAKLSLSLTLKYLLGSSNALFTRLNAAKDTIANIIPSEAQPFSPAQNPGQAVIFNYLASEPVELVTAHASAQSFPGPVPSWAERISRHVSLSKAATSRADRWQSTGLYAAPGEKVTVTIAPEAVGSGLVAIIGAHIDDLNYTEEPTWKRAPIVSRSFPLSRSSTVIASAFGGLIYIKGVANAASQPLDVGFDAVLAAPRFKAGSTTLAEWQGSLRQLPVPWAELENDSVIVTLQSEQIRTLDDPRPLLAALERGILQEAKLAAWDEGQDLPMRFVFDQQITAGYMHSGYPVMAWLSSQRAMTQFNSQYSPLDDSWGYFHEFGHNHQNADWVFDGTGEVSVNLFTLAALEAIYGRPKEEIQDNVMPAYQKRRMAQYFRQSPDFARLSSDPFDTLIPFLQLVDGFGWDSLSAVFKEYRGLSQAEHPATDAAKVDQLLTRFSKKVGRNLGPFFNAWGFRTSGAARDAVANLPVWLPEPDFPQAYANFVDPNVEIHAFVKLGVDTGPSVYASVFRDGQPCGVANVVNGLVRCTVPRGWSGVLSLQRGGYRFAPNQIRLNAVGADRFIGTIIASVAQEAGFTIRGRVIGSGSGSGGAGLEGVFPMADGADCRATDANGEYTCVVDRGWSGQLSMRRPAHSFSPASLTYNGVNASVQGADFVATQPALLTPVCTLAASPAAINDGGSVTLSASCTPAASSYVWNNTGFATSSASGTLSPAAPTRYSVVGVNAVGSSSVASVVVTVCGKVPVQSAVGEVQVGQRGPNQFSGSIGNDTFIGGPGIDTVRYNCPRSAYTLEKTGNGWRVSSSAEGVDELIDIERIRFADRTVLLDINGNAGKAYRVYQAAFDRTPDNGGMNFWLSLLDNGTSLQDVAGGFIGSDEFKTLYGSNPSNSDFVTRLYRNVLHRTPDQGGFDFWLGLLNNGQISRVATLIEFSESPENQSGVLPRIVNGIDLGGGN
jgi:hypothetical protein